MAKKKSENKFKNRHINKEKDVSESEYVFPNTNINRKQFCTVDDILKEFVPQESKQDISK